MNQQSDNSFPSNPYRSLRIGLHDYMLNLTPFFSPDWFTNAFIKLFGYPCYILTQCGIYFSTALFLQFAFNTLFRIYRSFTVRNLLKKQISVITALGFGFFGTITKTLMTAMIKSTHSSSDSDNSDSPHSPLAKNNTTSSSSKPRPPKYHTNIKTKLLSLKNKNPMKRSSPNSSPIKPPSSSVFHATSIILHTPLTPKIIHLHLQSIILTFHLIIIFLYNTVKRNSTTSQSNKPSSNILKSRHSPTPPPNNHITIDNHPIPPKKKYNILEDPVFIDSGIYPQLFTH